MVKITLAPIDYLLLLGVAILFFFALRYAVRHRHDTCGGDCAGCPYHRTCSRKRKK